MHVEKDYLARTQQMEQMDATNVMALTYRAVHVSSLGGTRRVQVAACKRRSWCEQRLPEASVSVVGGVGERFVHFV